MASKQVDALREILDWVSGYDMPATKKKLKEAIAHLEKTEATAARRGQKLSIAVKALERYMEIAPQTLIAKKALDEINDLNVERKPPKPGFSKAERKRARKEPPF